jgi:hypothetical protein
MDRFARDHLAQSFRLFEFIENSEHLERAFKGPSTYDVMVLGGGQRSVTRHTICGKFLRKKRDTGGGVKKVDFYHDIICGRPLTWRKFHDLASLIPCDLYLTTVLSSERNVEAFKKSKRIYDTTNFVEFGALSDIQLRPLLALLLLKLIEWFITVVN